MHVQHDSLLFEVSVLTKLKVL